MSKKKHSWPNFQHVDPLCGVLSTRRQNSVDHCQLRCWTLRSQLALTGGTTGPGPTPTWSRAAHQLRLETQSIPINDNHLLRHLILRGLEIQSCINLRSRGLNHQAFEGRPESFSVPFHHYFRRAQCASQEHWKKSPPNSRFQQYKITNGHKMFLHCALHNKILELTLKASKFTLKINKKKESN